MHGNWHDRTVLITGACGTAGCELLRQTAALVSAEIIAIDNNESETFFLTEEYARNPGVGLFVGDLRDREAMMDRMRGVDVALHAGALKQVFLCGRSPRVAWSTA